MTTIALIVAFVAIQLISLILFFIVLIKLFKKEGALMGILGFVFGIYTFIWGWVKHKEAALTKVMAFWTLLTVASFVIPIVIFTTGAMELMEFADNFKDEMT
ncbi:MAG: hypothetical protein JSW26_17170, partial [Desulfobacterales bacterium]